MIHIVFETANVAVLQQAIELDETIQGSILEIKDDYAVGPLKDIYTEEGIAARRAWWKEVLTGTDLEKKVDEGEVDDNKLIAFIVERLQKDEEEKDKEEEEEEEEKETKPHINKSR